MGYDPIGMGDMGENPSAKPKEEDPKRVASDLRRIADRIEQGYWEDVQYVRVPEYVEEPSWYSNGYQGCLYVGETVTIRLARSR